MPTLIINTNVSVPAPQQAQLLRQASATIAKALNKPESYVMVLLRADQPMCFGGDTAPTAYVELKSLGLPEEQTSQLSAVICDFLQQTLGLAVNRIYIEFSSPPRHLFGFNRSTF